MKQGKSIVELALQLQDIRDNAKDYLVPTSKLSMTPEGALRFENGSLQTLMPNDHSHGQIAGYAGVPKQYYDRLLVESPRLLADNVNHGFARESTWVSKSGKPETRLVRAYKDGVRAMLSSSYRRLDSYDCANAVLPVLADNRFEVVSSEITDRRMYIKALTPKVTAEIKKGDVVQFGLVISNSDVGAGSLRVEPLIYRLVCTNGMISNTAIKKFHIGRNMAGGDDVTELLSDETMALTDKAFWAQIQDVVVASMSPKVFEFEVNRLREAADQRIRNADIPEVVELAMKAVKIGGDTVKNNIIQYLANGADGAGLTRYGLVNGFTYAAQDEKLSYDRSIELERAGAEVLELHPSQWRSIAEPKSA